MSARQLIMYVGPGDEGRRLERSYILNDGRLTLSGTWTYDGRSYGFAITLVRVK